MAVSSLQTAVQLLLDTCPVLQLVLRNFVVDRFLSGSFQFLNVTDSCSQHVLFDFSFL